MTFLFQTSSFIYTYGHVITRAAFSGKTKTLSVTVLNKLLQIERYSTYYCINDTQVIYLCLCVEVSVIQTVSSSSFDLLFPPMDTFGAKLLDFICHSPWNNLPQMTCLGNEAECQSSLQGYMCNCKMKKEKKQYCETQALKKEPKRK